MLYFILISEISIEYKVFIIPFSIFCFVTTVYPYQGRIRFDLWFSFLPCWFDLIWNCSNWSDKSNLTLPKYIFQLFKSDFESHLDVTIKSLATTTSSQFESVEPVEITEFPSMMAYDGFRWEDAFASDWRWPAGGVLVYLLVTQWRFCLWKKQKAIVFFFTFFFFSWFQN